MKNLANHRKLGLAIVTALRLDHFLASFTCAVSLSFWNLGLIMYFSGGNIGIKIFLLLVLSFCIVLHIHMVIYIYNNPEKYHEVKLSNFKFW